MVHMKQPARAIFPNSSPIRLFPPLDNALERREEASNQGPKKGVRSLFVGHTSTSFPEDTQDLVSMLHRVCGDGGAYGGEETIRHDGARVIFLSVGLSFPGLVPSGPIWVSPNIELWQPFYHQPTLSLFFQWPRLHYFLVGLPQVQTSLIFKEWIFRNGVGMGMGKCCHGVGFVCKERVTFSSARAEA